MNRVKLFAIAKDEGPYIPIWVYHHLSLGFEEIEIWLNGITDNSKEICKKIAQKEPRFKYYVADSELKYCKKNDIVFQVHAYKKIFSDELTNKNFSHILFLDLDEWWMPKDFKSKISDWVAKYPSADAISFQWMLDTPSYDRQAFEFPINKSMLLQKNRHVKTLVKVTERVTRVNMHNHSVTDGNYIFSNGLNFELLDEEQHYRSKVSLSYFKNTSGTVDDAFILHNIYRSQVEYFASLMRGRAHVADSNFLKVNRVGYRLDPSSKSNIPWAVNETDLIEYKSNYNDFLSKVGLHIELYNAYILLLRRFEKLKAAIIEQPNIVDKYSLIFRGVNFDFLPEKTGFHFHIDSFNSVKGQPRLLGWFFKFGKIYEAASEFKFFLNDNTITPLSYACLPRPDVQRVVDNNAPLNSGFSLMFSEDSLVAKDVVFDKLHFDGFCLNFYFIDKAVS